MPSERLGYLFMPLIIVFVAVSLVGAAMYTPSLPAIASGLDAPTATVQLTMTVYLIGFATAQIFVGALSDRFGRKPVMIGGFVLFVASSFACARADSVELLIAARVFQAIGASVGIVISRAIIGDRFGHQESARYMAYVGMAAGLTPALSPMLGGLIQVTFGWRGVFQTMSGLGVLALAAAIVALRESHPSHNRLPAGFVTMIQGFGLLIRNARFLAYAVPAAASASMFFVFLTAGPVVMIGESGVSPDVYGLYALCMPGGYITGNFLSSRVLPRIGIDRGIVAGNVVTLAGAAIIAALGVAGHFSPLGFALPLVVIGVGSGIVVPAAYAGAVGTEPRIAGTASGFAGFLQFAAAALVNPLSALARHGSLLEMASIILVFAAAGAVGYNLLLRRSSRD